MQSQSNKTETVYKLHFLCREINQTQMTRHHSPRDVWLVLVIFCVFTFRGCQGDRDSKLLNVFNIVKFPNDGCSTVSGTYGVCYTASECDTLGQDNQYLLQCYIFTPRRHGDWHMRQWLRSLLPVQWNMWTVDWSE